jgi:hypothetical protein
MKHRSLWTALCALGLVACGGSDRASIVPEAPAGAYLVAVGTDQAFSSGYYYVADDGAATLAIEDTASARVTTLYRRDAGGAWQAVPGSGLTLPVKFLERRDDAMAATTLADLSGRYAASTGAGGVVFFAIDAQGRIGARAGSACAVSGTVSAGTPDGLFRVSLSVDNCAGIPANLRGVLVSNRAWVAQSFRLLLEGGNGAHDWWVYAE